MFTKQVEKNIHDALTSLDVSPNSRKIFLVLLDKGPLRAKVAASLSGVRRELTYRAFEELEEKSLVKKVEPQNGVSYFEPIHPEMLIGKLKDSNNHIVSIQNILSSNMSSLVSSYNKGMGLPHIEFKEGAEGLSYLYNDINDVGADIKLIRSSLDIQHPEIREIISNQRQKQIKNNIHTKMVTSFTRHPIKEVLVRDKKYLIDRRMVAPKTLEIPAQIIIYGEKVAITSFEIPIVTTIIENKAIRDTFDILFTNLWDQGKRV